MAIYPTSVMTIKPTSVVARKTVSNVAAALFAGGSQLAKRGFMEVVNDAANTIYYGYSSGVTTLTGSPIQPGESKPFFFDPNDPTPVSVYFIASANTSIVVEER